MKQFADFQGQPRQNTKKAAAFGINGKKNYISDFSGAFHVFKIVTWVPIWEGFGNSSYLTLYMICIGTKIGYVCITFFVREGSNVQGQGI